MTLFEWSLIQAGYEQTLLGCYSLQRFEETINIAIYANGQIQWREYLVDGVLSRKAEEGPAFESFYPTGVKASATFAYKGKLSRRTDLGPAYESFDTEGISLRQEYWVGGRRIEVRLNQNDSRN